MLVRRNSYFMFYNMLNLLGNSYGYFVAILTRRDMFQVNHVEIVKYPGTGMDRNLLIVQV